MVISSFNGVDYLFSGIFLLLILLSLWRGLVKEVVSITAWVTGIFVAYLFAPKLAAAIAGSSATQALLAHTGSEHPAAVNFFVFGLSFFMVLLGVLIVGGIISLIIGKVVQASGLSALNRLLGGVFGVVKAWIINLVIIFFIQMTSYAQAQSWQQSQLVQAYQPAVTWLKAKVGPDFENNLNATIGQALDTKHEKNKQVVQ